MSLLLRPKIGAAAIGSELHFAAGGRAFAWILLVGELTSAGAGNIDDELYSLLGVEAPDAKRTKPPCCDELDLPPVLDSIIASILDRADRVRRTRKQR